MQITNISKTKMLMICTSKKKGIESVRTPCDHPRQWCVWSHGNHSLSRRMFLSPLKSRTQ